MPNGMSIPLTFDIYKLANGAETLVGSETFSQDVVKIGKLSSSHLKIDDEGVNRMHAVVETTPEGEIVLIDLGSTGTVVNGEKVSKKKLASGDQIVLGNTKLVVTIGEAVSNEEPQTIVGRMPEQPRSTVMGVSLSNPPPAAFTTPAAVPKASVPAPFAVPRPQAAAPAGFSQGAAGAPTGQPMMTGFDPSAVELQDGSRAIEVAAMFEDAVVEVRHLSNPNAGVVSGATKGLLALGAGGLVVSFILFVISFVQVTALRNAWDDWDNAGKMHTEFMTQPEYRQLMGTTGPTFDVVVSICMIFGLYALVHGLFRRKEETQPRDFTIGPDANTVFSAPGELLPVGTFPLVRSTGTDYELLFTRQMTGDMTLEGNTQTLQQLADSGRAHPSAEVAGALAMTIPNGARAKIDLGQNTFLVNSVPPPRRYPVPFAIDWSQQIYTIGTAVAAGLFLAMVYSIPPDPKSLSLDAFMNDQRFAKFLIKPPEEKEEQIPEWLKKKGPDEAGGKGKRHKGEEGKMGKKTSKNKTGLYGLKGPKDNQDPHLAKTFAEEAANKAGVLGMLKATEGSHLASIFGRDSALGNDAENVMGGLLGTQIGEAYGVGGLGLVGTGRGGGGTGEGTIGLGSLGTIGKGGGGGSGSGYGRGAGGLGGRHAHAPDVVPGTALVKGSLDKEIIRRVVRKHMNEIRFCYEKELLRKPDLYGRVMIQFTIAGTGSVVASVVQQSTMNNAGVEQCMAQAVKRWEFPQPQGGGIVVVSYPFVLKAAGAE